jgi:hypothetical protein
MNALIIAKIAKKDQRILNQIKVGMVLTVEDQINARLDTNAKM